MSAPDTEAVLSYLLSLQDSICNALEHEDGKGKFIHDDWERAEGEHLSGGGRTRVMDGGDVFESAGINFSHVFGAEMPGSATAHRPELAGRRSEEHTSELQSPM